MRHNVNENVGYAADSGHAEMESKEELERTASNRIGEMNLASGHQLERGLKSRHIQFLALGGA